MSEQNQTAEIAHEQSHRSPAQYVVVALVLSVLTGLEIILYYAEESINRTMLVTALLSIAGIKFFLVAAYFMHLKDDPKMFRRWFIIGGVGALIIFTATLASMSIQDFRFF